MNPESPFYIERKTDEDCWRILQQDVTRTIIVRGARETGKSSLIARMVYRLQQEQANQKLIWIDSQNFQQKDLDDTNYKFFKELCYEFSSVLDEPLDIDAYWNKQQGNDKSIFMRCMKNYIVPHIEAQFILVIDEIERMLTNPFGKDFFDVLKSWHTKHLFPKMILFIGFSTEPYLLLPQLFLENPLNFGYSFVLPDFTSDEVSGLLKKYSTSLRSNEVQTIFSFLNGHPALTLLGAYALLSGQKNMETLKDGLTLDNNPFMQHLDRFKIFLDEQPDLLRYLERVLQGGEINTLDRFFYRLKSAGILKKEGSKIIFRNELYRRYFTEILPSLMERGVSYVK